MSVQAIVDKLYAEIVADTGAGGVNASDALNGRVYPVEGRQNAALPHMTFFVMSNEPELFYGGAVTQRPVFQFDIYSDKKLGQDAANDIESRLYALLNEKVLSSAPTGYDRALCRVVSRAQALVEEDAIRVTDEVQVLATDF